MEEILFLDLLSGIFASERVGYYFKIFCQKNKNKK